MGEIKIEAAGQRCTKTRKCVYLWNRKVKELKM